MRASEGDAAGARRLLGEALAGFRRGDRPDYVAQVLLELAALAVETRGPEARDLEKGRALLAEVARVVHGTCEHLFRDRVEQLAGEIALASGQLDRARAHFEASLAHVASRRGWNRRAALAGARDGLARLEAPTSSS